MLLPVLPARLQLVLPMLPRPLCGGRSAHIGELSPRPPKPFPHRYRCSLRPSRIQNRQCRRIWRRPRRRWLPARTGSGPFPRNSLRSRCSSNASCRSLSRSFPRSSGAGALRKGANSLYLLMRLRLRQFTTGRIAALQAAIEGASPRAAPRRGSVRRWRPRHPAPDISLVVQLPLQPHHALASTPWPQRAPAHLRGPLRRRSIPRSSASLHR